MYEPDLEAVGAELLARAASLEDRVWRTMPALAQSYAPAIAITRSLAETLLAGDRPADLEGALRQITAALDQAHRRH